VRRSRRRFWKSEDDGDKDMAYRTLHYVLVRLAYVLAPFTPFLAEELYQNLTGDEESIHLKDWMPAGSVNQPVINDMVHVRAIINGGLAQRAGYGIKVRQPVSKLVLFDTKGGQDPLRTKFYEDIVLEELNAKEIVFVNPNSDVPAGIDPELTPELKREGLMREVIRHSRPERPPV